MLTFRFTGADGKMVEAETLTSGMVGKEVKLEFTEDWDNLMKTAVFMAGSVTRDVAGVADVVKIPAEVLDNPLQRLYVGVYGVAADGRVTPTIRAKGPEIQFGADPAGDAGTDPALPVWAQLQQQVDTLQEEGNAVKDAVLYTPQTLSEEQKAQARENIGVTEADDGISDYWAAHLSEKIATIKELQRSGGADCYSFVVIADYHRYSNIGKRSPALIKHVMEECGIKFCLCLGDIQNGGAWKTKALDLAEWEQIENEFAPIRDRTLMIPGNHDGAYGSEDINGDGVISGTTDYYIYNLTHDEVYDLIFRKVGLIHGVTFDESHNGYYVDDPVSKVRYILVNTHYSDGATNENGTAVNNYMRKIRVGQPQMDMVISALRSVPDADWHVAVGMHIPLAAISDSGPSGDMVLLRDILEAYQGKTAYTSTFGTVGEFDYVSVNADFTAAKGTVTGAFCGHVHTDGQNDDYAFPIITSMSDDTSTAKIDGAAFTGEAGTITEQSFDVFTVNKRTGVINATKIGCGSDRVFGGAGEQPDTVVNLLDDTEVVLGGPGSVSGGTLNYYYESGNGQATLNPMCFYVEAGSTLNVSMSDYSNYYFSVHRYSCDESAKDADFSFTEGTSKNFGVAATQAYDSGWQNTDLSLEIAEAGVIAFIFRKKDYSALTAADTDAIKELLTMTVTTPVNSQDTPTVSYTNLADPTSEDWYSETHFIDSYGNFAEEANSVYNATVFVTNYVPVIKGDILRWAGIDMESDTVGYPPAIKCYDENKTFIRNVSLRSDALGTANGVPASSVMDENGVTAWEIMIRGDTGEQFVYENLCDQIRYVRFCAHWATTEDDIIITVNEEIVYNNE